jgi:hypothetical protein
LLLLLQCPSIRVLVVGLPYLLSLRKSSFGGALLCTLCYKVKQ